MFSILAETNRTESDEIEQARHKLEKEATGNREVSKSLDRGEMIIDKYSYLLDRRRALLIAKLTFIEGSNRPMRPWQFARKSDILIPISPCVTRSIDDLSDGTFFTMPLISPPPPNPFLFPLPGANRYVRVLTYLAGSRDPAG